MAIIEDPDEWFPELPREHRCEDRAFETTRFLAQLIFRNFPDNDDRDAALVALKVVRDFLLD